MQNNVEEAYCSFEVSKLLKDKGFEVPTRECYAWCSGGDIDHFGVIGWNAHFENHNLEYPERKKFYEKGVDILEKFSAPTHALAIEWLRANFSINIWIDCNKEEKWIWTVNIIKDGEYIQSDDWIEDLENLPDYYNTPKEAIEAGLLYVLKELI